MYIKKLPKYMNICHLCRYNNGIQKLVEAVKKEKNCQASFLFFDPFHIIISSSLGLPLCLCMQCIQFGPRARLKLFFHYIVDGVKFGVVFRVEFK